MASAPISNYKDFQQQVKDVQDKANKTQDVSQDDLQHLEDYLKTDDAKANLTQGQQDAIQNGISQLEMVVNRGTPDGTKTTASLAGLEHASQVSNQTWSSNIDALIKTISNSSDGSGKPATASNIKDVNGTALDAIPAETPLARAAAADGASTLPIKQSDGKAMDMYVVKAKDGSQQVFAGDGNTIGQPIAKDGGANWFKISNPAPGQDPYVSVNSDGAVKTGKTIQDIGGSADGQSVVETLSGSGAHGGYQSTGMSWVKNTDGSDAGKTAGQATGFHEAFAVQHQNPGSDLDNAMKDKVSGAPGNQAIDPTTGNIAVSAQDPNTKAYSLKFFDPKNGKDITQQVSDAAKADSSKTPAVSVNDDGTVKNAAGKQKTNTAAKDAVVAAADLPANSGISKLAADHPEAQIKSLGDGRFVAFDVEDNLPRMHVFNSDGQRTGYGNINESNTEANKGTWDAGNGTFVNFDKNGLTVDSVNKNTGNPINLVNG